MKKIILIFLIIIISAPSYSQQSLFSKTGPNAKDFGEDNSFRVCKNYSDHWKKPECRIGTFSQVLLVHPHTRPIIPSNDPLNFKFIQNPPTELIKKVDDYISKYPAMGLLIIKDGKIVVERYQYDRKMDMIFRGFSMSKTVTAMLVGIAHQKGFIKSLDDKVSNYWSEIKDSPVGETTIKEFLRMESGIDWGSTQTPDMYQIWSVLHKAENYSKPDELNKYLNSVRSNGTKGKLNYGTVDTEILSRVLVKATNKNITTLTSEWLWQPMGGRGIGRWLYATTDGVEQGAGGLHASLNDYGRFGVLLANDGKYKNTQVIPINFILDATDLNKTPKSHIGYSSNPFQYAYGYQTWIQPNKERTFCALGHYGQAICVQPSSKIVMVHIAVANDHNVWGGSYGSMGTALNSLWENILKDLGGSTN